MDPSEGRVHLSMQVANSEALLRVRGLKKVFRSGESDLVLFENLSFEVKRGEMLAIVGESGAGKSTLLHILSALDHASAGDVYCAELKLNSLSRTKHPSFAIAKPGLSGSFIICCRNLPLRRMSLCPCWCEGLAGRRRLRRLRAGCAKWDWSSARIIARASFRR